MSFTNYQTKIVECFNVLLGYLSRFLRPNVLLLRVLFHLKVNTLFFVLFNVKEHSLTLFNLICYWRHYECVLKSERKHQATPVNYSKFIWLMTEVESALQVFISPPKVCIKSSLSNRVFSKYWIILSASHSVNKKKTDWLHIHLLLPPPSSTSLYFWQRNNYAF
jgi:hypothetical protein